MAAQKRKSLGKGLSALIGGSDGATTIDPISIIDPPSALPDGTELVQIDPRTVRNNPKQPRRQFEEEQLQELAQSIRHDGVLEPVVVRRLNDGQYELVSGERRVRASILAELDLVPAICRDVSDSDMLRLGIIENVQREDLNAIELAEAYTQLIDEMKCTQDELSNVVGKKRATIANTIRLLQLPDDIQQHVISGELSMGHARALLSVESEDAQRSACRKIIQNGLSVREAEKVTRPKSPRNASTSNGHDPHVTAIEDELRKRLGTKVRLRADNKNHGKIEIEFYNLDDLDRILEIIRS
ncbi:MAG: ParB/RepB/Spo0J family partition protein [Candidatus Hydrogenedentota bacterium]